MVSCYDKDGNKHLLHSVDAKECCELMGWTTNDPSSDQPEKPINKKNSTAKR